MSDKEITLNINIPIEGNEKIFGKSSIANQFDFSETRSIQTVTLDQYLEDIKKLNTTKLFIKIDVEGSEYNVINGGMNTLTSFDVLLLIEIEKRHNKNYKEIFNKLTQVKNNVDLKPLNECIVETVVDKNHNGDESFITDHIRYENDSELVTGLLEGADFNAFDKSSGNELAVDTYYSQLQN